MHNFQIGKTAVAWGFVSQFFQYGVAILILPVILNKLPESDMAIWYIFMSVSAVVSLVDFGFSPSLGKQVSFVFSGVNELQADGVCVDRTDIINYSLLNDLYKTCVKLYRKIAFAIGILLLSGGSIYLFFAIKDFDLSIAISWILFIGSLVYNFYYNYILIFINGRGLVKENNRLIIISKSIYVISLFILIYCEVGLLSLVVANFLSTFVFRFLGKRIAFDDELKALLSPYQEYNDLTSVIWHNAKRYGVTNLGVVLLSHSSVFLSGLFLSLSEVAQLGLTVQIFSIICVMSRVVLSTFSPKFSSLFVQKDYIQIKKLFIKSQLFAYMIFIASTLVVIFYGNFILRNIIHSNVLLPNTWLLILYMLFYFMEITHGNCVTLISTENKVPFYKASIISGVMSILVTILLLINHLGIYSFPIGLICGSLPYNSWKWPFVVYKMLWRNGK